MSVFRGGVSIFGYDSIAKVSSESTMDFMDVGFGEKPVAVFIALPDYDSSNWFIATVFINQMYFILAKLATSMPGGKLLRRVMFILDEFGNLPALDNFENIITGYCRWQKHDVYTSRTVVSTGEREISGIS